MKHVITVGLSGGAAAIQPRGAGVDLRKMGEVEIDRVSEIEWSVESQRWQVRFLRGKLAGHYLSICGKRALFDDYDKAVAAEVDMVNLYLSTGRGHLIGVWFAYNTIPTPTLLRRFLGVLRRFWGAKR